MTSGVSGARSTLIPRGGMLVITPRRKKLSFRWRFDKLPVPVVIQVLEDRQPKASEAVGPDRVTSSPSLPPMLES